MRKKNTKVTSNCKLQENKMNAKVKPPTTTKPDDVSVKDFWAALNLSLSGLSEEFKNKGDQATHTFRSTAQSRIEDTRKQLIEPLMKTPIKPPAMRQDQGRKLVSRKKVSAKAIGSGSSKIVSGEPIKIIKLPSLGKVAKNNSGGGVNHLNLIQIKGNPVHSWQPKVVVDQEDKENVFSILRPDLNCVEINKLLIKNEDVVPRSEVIIS